MVNDRKIGKLDTLNKATTKYVTCGSLCYGDKLKLETKSTKMKVCEVSIFPRYDFGE